ncbi:MAG: hypothetical protein V4819_06195 [Verrucomicrobiota bacterium]
MKTPHLTLIRLLSLLLLTCGLLPSLTSCRITASVINGELIQRARIVNEQGDPLAASFHPGTPVPWIAGPFNFTDKNGYILINSNIGACTITSEGYEPFEAPTKDFPKTVVMKKRTTNKSNPG